MSAPEALSPREALAPLVRALGRGPGRARHLERHEAAAAMRLMLSGKAAPEAVGALLMLLRYQGENADEIAGFVDALRRRAAAWRAVGADVDWPTYAAGRSRGAPWFLLAAKLVAASGHSVLLHGWNSAASGVSDVRAVLAALEIPGVESPAAAADALAACGVAYAPLKAIDMAAYDLLRLRDVLGLRSPINTALRAMNPSGAETSLQGVFHPVYRALQQDVGGLLGQTRLLVLKGGGGEFERHPGKTVELLGLVEGAVQDREAPPLLEDGRKRVAEAAVADIVDVWRGAAPDAFAEATVIATAGAALLGVGAAADIAAADAMARDLWRSRHRRRAA